MRGPRTATTHVLVVDDSLEDRAELRRLLLNAQPARRYTFTEADSGAAALAVLASASRQLPDCMLLDYDLPDMVAIDVLAELVDADGLPPCPVVVVTGSSADLHGGVVLRAGAQAHLGKDLLGPAALARAIENAAERWVMSRELNQQAATLRRRADRDAFFLALAEATRALSDPQAIKGEAACRLGVHLKASRVAFCEMLPGGEVEVERGYVDGVAQIAGRHRLSDFGAHLEDVLQAGRVVVATDIPSDPTCTQEQRSACATLGIVASVIVPLHRNDTLVAVLAVDQDEPRRWTAEEIALVEEAAERTWAAVNQARAEARLRANEARLAELIQVMPSFTAVLSGPDHVFVLANAPYYELIGRGAEILGQPLLKAMPEIANQPFPELLDSVYRSGRPFEGKAMTVQLAHGEPSTLEERIVDFVYVPLRAADGTTEGILVHGLDRTEQFRAEQALRRSERELKSIADNTPDILARFDRQLRHVFVNAAVERATGRPKESFLGKTNRELGMPTDRCDLWDPAMLRVFDSGQPETIEFQINGPDGTHHFVSRLVPEFGPDGAVESLLAVAHDATEQKRSEQALRDADRHKNEFLATLAHELRTPLGTIKNGLAILRRSEMTDQQLRVLAIMDRQGSQLARLVDDLMDVSRVSQGKVALLLERIDVIEAIQSAVESCQPQIDAKQITLSMGLADVPLIVEADRTRLIQITANLLTNAIKYNRPNGTILVEAAREDAEAVIRVRDDGIGIAPEALPLVWNLFTQIRDTVDRSQGGVGIGLSLVKRLVELHGGSVAAESGGTGRGSTFTVRLPLARANLFASGEL